jgi:hypothetical protein
MNPTNLTFCPHCGGEIESNGQIAPPAHACPPSTYLEKTGRADKLADNLSFWWPVSWGARMTLIALCVFLPAPLFLFWLWILASERPDNWFGLCLLGLACLISTVAYLGVMAVRYHVFLPKCCPVQFKIAFPFSRSKHLSLYEQLCQWQRTHAAALRNIIAAACVGSLPTLFFAITMALEDPTCYTGSGLFTVMWFFAAGAGFLLHYVNNPDVNPSISLPAASSAPPAAVATCQNN